MPDPRGEPEPRHGTVSRYRWRRDPCRCVECRGAWNDYIKSRRAAKRGGEPTQVQRPRRHGTRYCYTLGCREPECVEANKVYQREYMRLHRHGVRLGEDVTDV